MPSLTVSAAAVTLAGLSVLVVLPAPTPPEAGPPREPSQMSLQGSFPMSATVAPARPAGPAATVPAGPTVPPPAVAPAGSGYRWPLSGRPGVLRRFVVGPERWSPGHRGVDLAAVVGERVLAAAPGVVTFAGMVAGRGVVAVQHADGIRTTYEPVTAGVAAGDRLSAGAPLGLLAAGDHCPRSCLHWGALRGDTYLDPLSLLAPLTPPVLLPLGGRQPLS